MASIGIWIEFRTKARARGLARGDLPPIPHGIERHRAKPGHADVDAPALERLVVHYVVI